MTDLSDEELLADLGVEVETASKTKGSARAARIIAGFEEIEQFFEKNGRAPMHGEDKDIFERLYAVRLDCIRTSEECRSILAGKDRHGLLQGSADASLAKLKELNDEELLADLGVTPPDDVDITQLKHVKTRTEVRAAEEVARQNPCEDFKSFKPLFIQVQKDLDSGLRTALTYKDDAKMESGDFFILRGQKVYVAAMGEEFQAEYGRYDRRLRLIYDNGTESNLLMRSFQRALNKDPAGRRITDPIETAPLFSGFSEEKDSASGTVYVLRSKSEHPVIAKSREVIHKIGVTGGDVKKRLANAKIDPTFLMADVEVVATYELSNINRTKLEGIIHKFFEPARLNIEIVDRFGIPVVPREWFVVPLFVIDELIERIKNGSITRCRYDAERGEIVDETGSESMAKKTRLVMTTTKK